MKDKVCFLCKMAIDTSKEYCKFTQYKKDKDVQSKAYYHINCFRDRMLVGSNTKQLQSMTANLLKNVNKMLGNDEPCEEVIV